MAVRRSWSGRFSCPKWTPYTRLCRRKLSIVNAVEGATMEIAFGKLMDRGTSAQWVQLTAHVLRARATSDCCAANQQLEAAVEREPHGPVSPAYRLWVAD